MQRAAASAWAVKLLKILLTALIAAAGAVPLLVQLQGYSDVEAEATDALLHLAAFRA
jgi:hypothetical protein